MAGAGVAEAGAARSAGAKMPVQIAKSPPIIRAGRIFDMEAGTLAPLLLAGFRPIFFACTVISEPGRGSCRCGFPPVLAVAARRREPSFASPTALPFGVKSIGVTFLATGAWTHWQIESPDKAPAGPSGSKTRLPSVVRRLRPTPLPAR